MPPPLSKPLSPRAAAIGARIFVWVCILLGAGLITGGVLGYKDALKLWFTGEKTTATVTGLTTHRASDNRSDFYMLSLEFTGADGRPQQAASVFAGRSIPYDKDQRVPIMYDRAHPQQPQIHTFWRVWGTFLLYCTIGLLLLALGIVCL